MRGRVFQHSSGIEPMSPDSLRLSLTTKPLIHISCWKKTAYVSSYFATCNRFFSVQDCRTRIFQLEYQGQTRFLRILERKPLIDTSYRIRHSLELKWNIFISHNFCSMLIEQLINLEKVKTFSTSKKWKLYRIQFETCCFVPMSYFYSETNDC